jgi:PIN domain nuclease of toxin-antitoxin system
MKYLLDTHVLLWHFKGDKRLSTKVQEEVLFHLDQQIYISMASLWEVAIKISIGKLDFLSDLTRLHRCIVDNEFKILVIKKKHVESLLKLPFIHRDPFDRLLIATTKAEEMTIITADENIHKYDVAWVW